MKDNEQYQQQLETREEHLNHKTGDLCKLQLPPQECLENCERLKSTFPKHWCACKCHDRLTPNNNQWEATGDKTVAGIYANAFETEQNQWEQRFDEFCFYNQNLTLPGKEINAYDSIKEFIRTEIQKAYEEGLHDNRWCTDYDHEPARQEERSRLIGEIRRLENPLKEQGIYENIGMIRAYFKSLDAYLTSLEKEQ